MKTNIVKIIPKGTITKLPDAQTLFGAICSGIKDIYGEEELERVLEDLKKENTKNRKFVLSSTYPKGFLPAPVMNWFSVLSVIEKDKQDVIKSAKKIKKIEYVDIEIYKKIKASSDDKIEEYKKEVLLGLSEDKGYRIENRRLYKNPKKEAIDRDKSKDIIYMRNSINRISSSTDSEEGGNLYYYKRKFLKGRDVEYYFIFKTDDMAYYEPVFEYISDCGIGFNKNIGVNNFELSIKRNSSFLEKIKEIEDIESQKRLLLSKTVPIEGEVDYFKSEYKIGFETYKPEIKKIKESNGSIREIGKLLEGSLLFTNKKIVGELIKVDEKRYHNAIGMTL